MDEAPMNLDMLPDLDELPVEVVQTLIDESQEEIKQFVVMIKSAADAGNVDRAQLLKQQMRRQVEFIRSAQRALRARRVAVPFGP